MAETSDKRRNKRIKIFLPVDCHSKHYLQSKNSLNISAGGIFIETDLLEKPGSAVELEFVFKVDDKTFEKVFAQGEVVWVGETKEPAKGSGITKGMGIKFINPSGDLLRKIEKFYIKGR